MVHHDNYYKRQDRPFAERCLQNYDHPDAFDTDLMIADLKALKRGETIHCPVYDYAIHNRTDETVEIQPTKVVIVEGILIFQSKELRDLLDIKIFVETDADVRILRRALRDVEECGGRVPCAPCRCNTPRPPRRRGRSYSCRRTSLRIWDI